MSEENTDNPLCQICQKRIEKEDIAEVWSSVDFKIHAWHQRCWDKVIEDIDKDQDLGDL